MIDLHIHTKYTDGTNTTEEILKLAENRKMNIISITDHDKVNAYLDLENQDIRKCFSGKIIPGCEVTTTYKGGVIEILGYGIDYKYMYEKLNSEDFKKKEQDVLGYIEYLIKKGVKLNKENIFNLMKQEPFSKVIYEEFIIYPQNDKFLLDIKNKETFSNFIRNEMNSYKSMLFFDREKYFPSIEKVINEIHNAGGLAFLAHAYIYAQYVIDELEEIISNYDLDGLECFYTKFTEIQTKEILDICKKHNLYKSGGTDFHGDNPNKKGYIIGKGLGNLEIKDDLIEEWLNKVIII